MQRTPPQIQKALGSRQLAWLWQWVSQPAAIAISMACRQLQPFRQTEALQAGHRCSEQGQQRCTMEEAYSGVTVKSE